MITFIIPIKSQKIANSWELVSKLAERTIRSICNQTSPNFRVVVVCHEKPNIQYDHPHLHYVEVDFPPPYEENQDNQTLRGYDYVDALDIPKKNEDKARKILIGIDYASSKFQSSHIMVVDADDCVNRHLAEYVDQHLECDGWVLKKGYVYREGSRFIYLNVKNFNQVSGTSVIIRTDLHNLLFTNPNYYNCHFVSKGNLQPLPFIGALYSTENGENILSSRVVISEMKSSVLKTDIQSIIKKLVKYRIFFFTKSIINDFGLYNVT